eukprot:CAMPEP_0168448292 /NCGR_PEP_ID=MMETSP0228-20121227/47020_1 /TAXON_ID=133427 /ORGANISM="Protoceratium reticulatum, Strain CCCM 535 (=CCMP 1889)" /LENGTH=327 /DNA_ID=CAMNT_0008462823 /DNA_START=13 /DNA_END=999 /DNA_ORIENTATION=-
MSGLAMESYCKFDASKVAEYCAANTLDKTLVAPGDCSTWRYSRGALDSDRSALERCRRLGKPGCHIEDRRGDLCFKWAVPDWAQPHFRNYCAAKTPKNFFMRSDATRVYWLHENRVTNEKCPGCYLFDHNGARCPCTDPGDMRCKMQACMQYEPYWCWATSVAMVAGYYFPDRYPNTRGDGPNCRGLECKIVGEFHYPKTPGICCRDKDHCKNSHAKSGTDIINALNKYTEMFWTRVNAPVDPLLLKRVLMDGHPVVWDVRLPEGGGHAMVIGGTDGMGNFFVHDSMNAEGKGSYQILPWAAVLSLKAGVATMWGAYVPISYVQQAR